MSRFSRPLSLLILGMFLAAGSVLFAGGSHENNAASAAGAATTKLVLATNNAPEGNGIAQALRQWGQSKGIQVDVVAAPYSNIYEKEVLDLSQKTGLYDIVLLDDPWFTQFAENKWLTDLTPYFVAAGQGGLSSDFVDKSTAICKYPYATGLIYAFPAVGNAQMFFYRKDILAQYGMPNGPAERGMTSTRSARRSPMRAAATRTVTCCAAPRATRSSRTSCRSSGASAPGCSATTFRG